MKVPFWLIELLRRQGKGLKCGAKGNLLDFTFNSKRLFNINLRPVEVLLDFQREVLQTKDTGTWQRRTSKWLLLMGYEWEWGKNKKARIELFYFGNYNK